MADVQKSAYGELSLQNVYISVIETDNIKFPFLFFVYILHQLAPTFQSYDYLFLVI